MSLLGANYYENSGKIIIQIKNVPTNEALGHSHEISLKLMRKIISPSFPTI